MASAAKRKPKVGMERESERNRRAAVSGAATIFLGGAMLGSAVFLGDEVARVFRDPANQNVLMRLVEVARDTGAAVIGAGGLREMDVGVRLLDRAYFRSLARYAGAVRRMAYATYDSVSQRGLRGVLCGIKRE